LTSSADTRESLARQVAELDSQIERFRLQKQDTRPVEAASEFLKAKLAGQEGDLEAMLTHYREAVSGFERIGMGAEQATVATEGARAMQAASRIEAALELAGRAVEGAESAWLSLSAADRLQQIPRELVAAADAAVPIAFAAGKHAQIFDILQRCKARWFNEQMLMREVERLPLLGALAGPEARSPLLNQTLAALDAAWNGFFEIDPVDARPAAEAALMQAYTEKTAQRRPFRPLEAATSSIDSCRSMFRPQEGLLEFFVSRDETFAVLLTAATLEVYPLGIGALELEGRVMQAAVALQSTPNRRDFMLATQQSTDSERREALTSVGRVLYPASEKILAGLGELLFGKLAHTMRSLRRLIVCPHWVLHAVPFHALDTQGAQSVAATTAITYAPSASCWERLRRLAVAPRSDQAPRVTVLGVERRQRPRANWFSSALAEGAPQEPPSLFELEAQAVASVSGATPLLGTAATKQAFAAALAEADIVHVSCHNALGRPTALTDGLLLADGIVSVAELMVGSSANNRGPQLVALSACRSGLDRVEPGDLRVGPCDALAARYGCSVISSLWSVDAEATKLLMDRLYAHRRDVDDWAEALRRAQHDTRSGASQSIGNVPDALKFSEPYYWAGFFVYGP
jgi:CHAT domain-containing protein